MKLPVSRHVVLAVAGLSWLCRPVSAQPAPPDEPIPTFEIYGTLVPFVEAARTTGATEPGAVMPGTTGATQVVNYSGVNSLGRGVVDVGTSNLGFRGGVDITANLAVLWQIESGAQVDGTGNANIASIASRNSYLGLTGKSWGTLFVGQWDTPYKWTTTPVVNPIRAGFLADYNGILHNPGFGISSVTTQQTRANAGPDAAFYRRQGNSIQYWTPAFSGVTGRIAYSTTEGRSNSTAMAPSIKPSLVSLALAYDRGPIKLRYAYEAHLDYFGVDQLGGSSPSPTNRSSLDQGHQVVAQYTNVAAGYDTRAVGVFEYLAYDSDDTTVDPMNASIANKYSRAAFYGLIDQTVMGKHHVWGAFGLATAGSCEIVSGANCSTAGLGANMITLGYLYRFSRTTDFFVAAYRITNKASSSYVTSPGLGVPAIAGPGADLEAIGVGFIHAFSAKIGATKPPPVAPPPAPLPQPEAAPPAPPPGGPAPVPPPNPTP
jgi:predicted porin